MKIQVKKLIAQNNFTGEFDYALQSSKDTCLIPLCQIGGDIKIKGKFEIFDDDSVAVNFTVSYIIKGQCSYCLNDAEKFIEKDFDILFVTEDDPDNYRYDGVAIDLQTAFEEAIFFSQPNILLCKEDCAGVDVNN